MYNFKRQGYKLLFESETYNSHVYHLLYPLLSLVHLYQLRNLLHLLQKHCGFLFLSGPRPNPTYALSDCLTKAHKDHGIELRKDRTRIITPGRDLDPSVRIQGHPLLICSQLSLEDYSCPQGQLPRTRFKGQTLKLN